jgi:hypothetical protein
MKTRLGMRLMALSLVLLGIKVGWAQSPVREEPSSSGAAPIRSDSTRRGHGWRIVPRHAQRL